MCNEIVEEALVGGSWEELEVKKLIREILEGGAKRKEVLESHLREDREVEEATVAMLEEESQYKKAGKC